MLQIPKSQDPPPEPESRLGAGGVKLGSWPGRETDLETDGHATAVWAESPEEAMIIKFWSSGTIVTSIFPVDNVTI
jgi:hypothetical protein